MSPIATDRPALAEALGVRAAPSLAPWPAGVVPAMRERALADLFFLCKAVLGFTLVEPEPHGALCQFIQRPARYGKKLALTPRGTFKSSIVTCGHTLHIIAQDPNERILIDSDLRANSKKFAGLVRWHLEANPRWLQLFGEMKQESEWTQDYFSVQRTLARKEPTVMTAGMDQVVVSLHFDRITGDDLVNNTNIVTREQLDKTLEHVRLLSPILEIPEINPKAELILVGTRWDDNDVYGTLLRESGMTDDEIQVRLEEGEASIGEWDVFFRSAEPRSGKQLFSVFTPAFLERKKRELGPFLYSANYLNDPAPATSAVFLREWFRKWEPPLPSFQQVLMSVDPAFTEKTTGDYAAIVVAGVTARLELYLLLAERRRYGVDKLCQRILEVYDEFSPDVVGIELKGWQQLLAIPLREAMAKAGRWLPIKELNQYGANGKEPRIKSLVPFYASRAIFHAPGMVELEMELSRWPRRKGHDDLADAEGYIVQQMLPGQVADEEQQTYEPDSMVTGY